ncbi:putative transcription factor HSF-type-DNA-binding family [Helianthus annuus]|nr:putative transcription factor HSF-type-DNA-binding family [Helianthus annuus]KAJ0726811.1 putative transcription factor HSF-type-DNA-binding family [Helianthus annuus]
MVQRSSPAPFLVKTYQMVDDPTTNEMISWNENGNGFVVWKTADFARDLLPYSFKHNNFSSFVRQLNTYGFHKTLPDKWEFANDYFKRGQQKLLNQIRRRKTVTSSKPKTSGDGGSTSPPSGAGNDLGSSSTSSPDSNNPVPGDRPMSEKLENLSGENEKLKKEKKVLTTELAEVKKQCGGLVAFLTECVKVSPEQISRIIGGDTVVGEATVVGGGDVDDDDNEGDCFRLFGVLLKDGKKKRRCVEESESEAACMKKMKLQSDVRDDVTMFRGRVGYIR